jgi:ribosomal protein S18 acetylase RimI-like enzyme
MIRQLDPTDEPFLWEMLYHALYVPEGLSPFPKEIVREPEIAKYVDRWGKDGDRGYIAVEKLTLQSVGAAWIRLFTEDHKGYGYVSDDVPELSIALLPTYRNQGIGSELLNSAIDHARGKYPALSLSVSVDNPAVRLYERFGFKIVDLEGTSLTMRKELNPEA